MPFRHGQWVKFPSDSLVDCQRAGDGSAVGIFDSIRDSIAVVNPDGTHHSYIPIPDELHPVVESTDVPACRIKGLPRELWPREWTK